MKGMEKCAKITGMATMSHFLVDGLCVCCLYMMTTFFPTRNIAVIILVYNVLAFMSQPLIGIMADALVRKNKMLKGTMTCLFLAVMLVSILPHLKSDFMLICGLAISTFLGIGNSLFHVWGGKRIIMQAGNEIKHLGVYVSTGALGLSVGMLFYSWQLLYVLSGIFLLVVVYAFFTDKLDVPVVLSHHSETNHSHAQGVRVYVVLLILLIMVFVSFRSYFGNFISSTITKSDTMTLVIGVVSMFGKMAGGWVACRLGLIRSFLLLMSIAVAFSWGDYCFLGIFAMNCTMPITLYWANYLLKGKEGLAFGLLALALLPGYYLFFI